MQHSPVRSIFIIWFWKDHLASGLIEVTNPILFYYYNENFAQQIDKTINAFFFLLYFNFCSVAFARA